jgi:hypothetical protein
MDIEDIINRAVTDEAFARELSSQAAAAAGAGIHSEAWREYVSRFADTPEELEELIPPVDALRIRWTTITTLTTLTTAGCATTTTTTTTTEVPKLCNPKKIAFEIAGETVYPLAGFPIKSHKDRKGKQD